MCSNQLQIDPTKYPPTDFTPTFMVLAADGGCGLITNPVILWLHAIILKYDQVVLTRQ